MRNQSPRRDRSVEPYRVAGGQRGVAAAVDGAPGVGDPHVVAAVGQDVAQGLVRGVHQPRHAVLRARTGGNSVTFIHCYCY